VWTAEMGLIGGVIDGILGAIKGAINLVVGLVNGVIDGINSFNIHVDVPNPFGGSLAKVDWEGLNLGKIPYLHDGGIVPGLPGTNVLTVLQAGELVTPTVLANGPTAPRGAVGGTLNVTFNISGAQDDEALARRVMQALQRERLRQGMSFAG